jgi:hypothetical protein
VKKEKDFVNYMAKYLSKKETDPALVLNCKVWGCSRNLSRMNVTLGEDITPDFHDIMNRFTLAVSEGYKQMKYATVYFTSLANKKKVPPEILSAVADARDEAERKKEKKKVEVQREKTERGEEIKRKVKYVQTDILNKMQEAREWYDKLNK